MTLAQALERQREEVAAEQRTDRWVRGRVDPRIDRIPPGTAVPLEDGSTLVAGDYGLANAEILEPIQRALNRTSELALTFFLYPDAKILCVPEAYGL